MTFLAPLEPKLKTAVEARWVSHLPQSAIDGMLDIWESLTGTKRPFRQGCGTCILHLCIDLGTLYFAQKDYEKRIAAELAAKKKAEEAAKKKEAEEKAEAERQKAALEEAAKKAAADATATAERVSGLAKGLEPGGPEGNEPSGTSEKPNTQAAEKQEKAQNAPKGAKGNKTTAGGKKSASGNNSKQK